MDDYERENAYRNQAFEQTELLREILETLRKPGRAELEREVDRLKTLLVDAYETLNVENYSAKIMQLQAELELKEKRVKCFREMYEDSRKAQSIAVGERNDALERIKWLEIHLEDYQKAQARIKELEARNAELEKIDARFVADAELGRLVGAMPNGFELQHHGRIWFCVQYPRTEHHLQVDASTPKEALKAAGIGKEAESPQEWRSRPPTVCQQYEMYKGGAWPRSCPTCGFSGKCQYDHLKIKAESEPIHSPE